LRSAVARGNFVSGDATASSVLLFRVWELSIPFSGDFLIAIVTVVCRSLGEYCHPSTARGTRLRELTPFRGFRRVGTANASCLGSFHLLTADA
jgi:hypothetical protein